MSSATEVLEQPTGQDRSPEENAEVAAFLAELIAVGTHDLRSPLGAIAIFCELLQMSDSGKDDAQERSIGMMQEATAKAQLILDDLSEYSRILRGILRPNRAPVDLTAIWQEAVIRVTPYLEGKNISTRVQFAPGSYTTISDAPRLQEIATSVLECAALGVGEGEEIIVEGKREKASEALTITVRSSGGKCLPEEKQAIRGRLGGGQKPGQSRYTLGVASRLVTLMRGSLKVRSDTDFEAVLQMPASSEADQPNS